MQLILYLKVNRNLRNKHKTIYSMTIMVKIKTLIEIGNQILTSIFKNKLKFLNFYKRTETILTNNKYFQNNMREVIRQIVSLVIENLTMKTMMN